MSSFDQQSLFIGDLSCFCVEADVFRLFQQFGEIISIRLMRNPDNNHCLGYGFVTFKFIQSAQAAMAMHGAVFLGRKIRVGPARTKKTFSKTEQAVRTMQKISKPFEEKPPHLRAQIHFSYLSEQASALVTEETIRNIFMEFGVVEDVSIKRTQTLPNSRVQHGYGFIRFRHDHNEVGAALQAVSVICRIAIDDVTYDCCLTRSFESSIYPENPSSRQGSVSSSNEYMK